MTDEKKYALQAKSIVKYYEDGNSRLDILKGIDLDVAQGEMVAIIGASGSGKSTLLHTLGLLDEPTSGEVLVNGTRTAGLSEKQRSQIRNQSLGFVYQFHHLLPEFSALDNVAMPLIVRRMDRGVARKMAEQVLAKVGLAERVTHKPSQLSGGERQRVALARALVANPVCVLADEPTGNLDRETAQNMFALLKSVNKEFNTAFVIVTHDPKLAELADRQLVMEKGRLNQKNDIPV
ncbi:lipoprotein-releasing ABC transporter ATP-binding protein LolD [Advenella alkanexedens]|jgi:lipoprotein-releasing system ATP-binding protein|uniref:Lipoprotein-releasing system ATP-binding protein LolD n=1 Tax=Advenella alkanexedens TaxID=1481665 RepID=A0ABS6NP57_9BURK|nr:MULTISPECIES: lipoprotein-releasing ABC transporter ATP-binding protein LolD [Advenella]MBV4397390.1 lipoprotein-releasing ABC transporter ATP-binding protein LolD [Advenella alkanexedens]MDD3758905.1 lipoprotein-releasing ABC transporter ATP-binding protein LolD [Advenella sp.]NLN67123.1 lipoprotein-releasing ABC transporter ATP-binding protein LolD [Alcaligenaceae bacterium]